MEISDLKGVLNDVEITYKFYKQLKRLKYTNTVTMLTHMPKYALETFKMLFFTIEKCLNYQLTKKIEDCDLVLKINLKNTLAKK